MIVNILIYVCIYACVCIVLFDVMFALHVYREERLMPRRTEEMRSLLAAETEPAALEKLLMKEEWLKSFMICSAASFSTEERKRWVRANLPMLVSLAQRYRRRPAEYRTMLARMICNMSLGGCLPPDFPRRSAAIDTLSAVFIEQMADPSAFLRQSAFRALVSLGDAQALLRGFVRLDRDPGLVNVKLLSDDILAFPGDRAQLMSLLWACFRDFEPSLQTVVINAFRLMRVDEEAQRQYYEELRLVMLDPDADREVRYAAIRYFRKHIYPAARRSLMELLDASGLNTEKFAAIAATALQGYPGSDTEALLLRHLGDRDWFVRFNSAESLIALGVDYERLVMESDDRYAKEMLIYRAEVYKLRRNGRRSA